MTLTPTDHARIVALAKNTWAEVPEAMVRLRGVILWPMVSEPEGWGYVDSATSRVLSARGPLEEVAIALIESACLPLLPNIDIRNNALGGVSVIVGDPLLHRYRPTFTAPTLVEALLLAVRAKGKKEPTRE